MCVGLLSRQEIISLYAPAGLLHSRRVQANPGGRRGSPVETTFCVCVSEQNHFADGQEGNALPTCRQVTQHFFIYVMFACTRCLSTWTFQSLCVDSREPAVFSSLFAVCMGLQGWRLGATKTDHRCQIVFATGPSMFNPAIFNGTTLITGPGIL